MKLVHILVEGQTEEEFVRDILNDYLQAKDIYLNPILAKTKRPIGGNPAFRGGIVSYGKIEFDIRQLVNDKSATLITTMIDFYALPSDFPGFGDEANKGNCFERVAHLEKKFSESINHPRFYPYLAIHEFEALLFVKPEEIVKEVSGNDEKLNQVLKKMRDIYSSPEEINLKDPPSKRIKSILKSYDKVGHGYLIAINIGIAAMREECKHFDEWLIKLESL